MLLYIFNEFLSALFVFELISCKIWSLMSLKGLRYFMEVHTYFYFNKDRKSVKALHRGMSQNCR